MERLRDQHIPAAFGGVDAEVFVTGDAAINVDQINLTEEYTPFLFGFVLGLSFLLLMIVFRSILVPLTATLGFLVSVLATLGATVLIFQEGTFGLMEGQPIVSFMPIFLIGVVFGLAMDYQVFLVSRMREAHVHGMSTREAVVDGFRNSARVVTAAAAIMTAVFAAFMLQDDAIAKSMGFALAAAVGAGVTQFKAGDRVVATFNQGRPPEALGSPLGGMWTHTLSNAALILLVDLYLPRVSGLEVMEAATEANPDILSIVMTGNPSVESSVAALRAGAWDYLPKPCSATPFAILVAIVAEGTGRSLTDALSLLSDLATETRTNELALLRVVLVAGAAVCAAIGPLWRRSRTPTLVLAAGSLVTASLAGHAWTAPDRAIAVVTDLVHLGAVAVWIGGILALLVALPLLGQAERMRAATRFSAVALAAVVVVALSGTVSGWQQLGALGDLTSTAYGQLLLLKVVGFLALVGFGVANRTRLIPLLDRTVGPLQRSLRGEVAVAALVLVVTAGLVQQPPARTETATGPFETTVTAETGEVLTAVVEPAETGANDLHLYFSGPAGPAAMDAVQVTAATGDVPARSLQVIPVTPDHVTVAGASLPSPGTWIIPAGCMSCRTGTCGWPRRTRQSDPAGVTALGLGSWAGRWTGPGRPCQVPTGSCFSVTRMETAKPTPRRCFSTTSTRHSAWR